MTIEVRRVDSFDNDHLSQLMERNLGPSISTKHLRRREAEGFSLESERIRLGAFDGNRLVGLSHGQAESPSRFHMHVSLVEREYRGRGIYRELLTRMLAATSNYDEVDSNHHLLNNPIIATKLRAGFHIIGFDQTILVGPRVTLRYFHNLELLSLMQRRMGWAQDELEGTQPIDPRESP
ncbi:MAG: hypothetical protein AB8I08_04990 [Sandaracinaceae bacterium]